MVMDEAALASFKRGDIFNVPCEHCKEKRRAEFVKKWQDKSRLTEQERLITFDDIKINSSTPGTAEVKQACQEMVDGTAFMLTIQGTSGNAKSVALMATVNAFLKRGDSALYITLTDALDWIKDAFNSDRSAKDDETALGRYKQLEYATLLVVDEMQDANESGWTLSILANLVNRRQRDAIDGKCFTIFCTNKPVDTLPAQIYSRMKDNRNRTVGKPIVINNDKDLRAQMKRKVRK
jgi:DNA replication protein DnaC